jgi:hypothetical protein
MDSWGLKALGTFPGLRVLAWHGATLYAARGYRLLKSTPTSGQVEWSDAGRFHPAWWRSLTAANRLTLRLVRDGFHALAVLPSGHLIAALPGAIATLEPGQRDFRVTHRVLRGTRPLHFAITSAGRVYFGEYFDNPERTEVHIYGSEDQGKTWNIAHTFSRGAIRHIHNIAYDCWADCLWILTGDEGRECQVLRASCDLSSLEVVLGGNQQARAVALVPAEDGVYFATDTPFEANRIYHLDRCGRLTTRAGISSSCIYGCRTANALFFSTMVEPSPANRDQHSRLYGSRDGRDWQVLAEWEKDSLPMGLFQYGNAILPDGDNPTDVLALTTIAVRGTDLQATLWKVVAP